MGEYFDKTNVGGQIASEGFGFQDCCALLWFMKEVNKPEFKCVTLETIDDFTVMYKDGQESLFQVKSNRITKKVFNDILKGHTDNKKKYGIIAQDYDDKIKNCIKHKAQFEQAKKCGRDQTELDNIKVDLEEEAKKLGIDFDKFLDTEINVVSDSNLEEAIMYRVSEWCNDHSFKADVCTTTILMLSDIAGSRKKRGFVDTTNLETAAQKAKAIEPKHVSIKSVDYDEYLIGQMKEKIADYPSMKEVIEAVCDFVECGKYSRAKEKIDGLLGRERDYFTGASIWLDIKAENYGSALKCCDECLRNKDFENVKQGILYYYKGIIAEHKKNCKDAYKYYSRSIKELGETELFTDLAFRYARCATAEKKDYDVTFGMLERCTDMMKDDVELLWVKYYHPYYADKNGILEQMLETDESKCFIAHAFLAENYRSIGKYHSAVREYETYFSRRENTNDYKHRMGYVSTLLDLGNIDEANNQFMFFANAVRKSPVSNIKDGQTTCFVDISWDRTRFYSCTREKEMYLFSGPLSDIGISTDQGKSEKNDKVFIGTTYNRFAKAFMMRAEEDGAEFDESMITKPVIGTVYSDRKEYLQMKDNIVKRYSMNHDYDIFLNDKYKEVPDEIGITNYKIHYLEYIANGEVSVELHEKEKAVFGEIEVGGIRKGITFEKKQGMYNFRKRMENADEVAIQFYTKGELLELTIPPECVKLTY